MSARSLFSGAPAFRFGAIDSGGDRLALSFIPESGLVQPTVGPRVGYETAGNFEFTEQGGAGTFPAISYSSVAVFTQLGSAMVTLTVEGAASDVSMSGGGSVLKAILPESLQLPAGEWVVGTMSYTQGGSTLIGYVACNGAVICLHPIAGNFSEGALSFSGFTGTYTVPV